MAIWLPLVLILLLVTMALMALLFFALLARLCRGERHHCGHLHLIGGEQQASGLLVRPRRHVLLHHLLEMPGYLADGLVEEGQHLVGRQLQLLADAVHVPPLQPHPQQDGHLQVGESDGGQAALEEPGGQQRHQVQHHVVVHHVAGIHVQAVQVVHAHVHRQQLPGGEGAAEGLGGVRGAAGGLSHLVLLAFLLVLLLLCSSGVRVDIIRVGGQLPLGVHQGDCERGVQRSQVVAEQRNESALAVAHEGLQPARAGHGLSQLRLLQVPQQHRRVLPGEVAGRLPHIAGPEAPPGPEPQQGRSESARGPQPRQALRGPLGQRGQQGRQLPRTLLLVVAVVCRLPALQRVRALAAHLSGRQERGQLAVEVGHQQLHRAGPVAHPLHIRMRGDANDASAGERAELRVVELRGHGPGNHVPGSLRAPGQLALHALLGDAALEGDLQHAQHVGQRVLGSLVRAQQHQQAVGGRVRQHLQVVGRALVVCRGVQTPDTLQQALR
mmetsp:Transcript_27242/g.37528  ORF Transcript_27242/g.37528 Transcript_27242/m.37528 type:complete len:497 (+) Transcript_27242:97-1587(+)